MSGFRPCPELAEVQRAVDRLCERQQQQDDEVDGILDL
jgi:hypothetical protein